MKKLLCFLALTIGLIPPLRAQEAEAPEGFSADLSLIGRIEATPWFGPSADAGTESGFSFGNSSFYTLFEGTITNGLTFCLENHWLGINADNLYKNTFHSDWGNWLDMCYFNFSHNWFDVTWGKFTVPVALYEYDDYDYDANFPLVSALWSQFQCYQWGVSLGFTPVEGFVINAYAQTSPYGEKFFKSGLFLYGGKISYDTETFGIHAGYTALEMEKGSFNHMVTGGIKWSDNGWTIYDDLTNRPGDNDTEMIWEGFSNLLSAKYEFSDAWALEGRFEYSRLKAATIDWGDEDIEVFPSRNSFNAGINLNWMPVEGLRAHLQGGYRFGDVNKCLMLSIGVTYNLSFSFNK